LSMDWLIWEPGLLILPMIDTIATWFLVRKSENPDMEVNLIAKALWRFFGFNIGSLFMGGFAVIGIGIMLLIMPMSFSYMLIGMYAVVFLVHFVTFLRFYGVQPQPSDIKIERLKNEVRDLELASEDWYCAYVQAKGFLLEIEKNLDKRGVLTEVIEKWNAGKF